MQITIPYIQRKYRHFNDLIFNGRLPEIPIRLSDSGRFMGQCTFETRRHPDGRIERTGFTLRVNTRISMPEHDFEDVIIHEMIHLFIGLSGLEDTAPHGEIFRSVMRSINSTHNRNITVSYRATIEQKREAVSARPTWHVIAILRFHDGRTGIKVLPRVAPRIITYRDTLAAHPEIRSIELYLHNDPFFNRYPVSAALRFHSIDQETLSAHLDRARPLRIDGDRILESPPVS